MMRLLHVLIKPWVMLKPMNPINARVGKKQEKRHGKERIRPSSHSPPTATTRSILNTFIKQAMPAHFPDEPRKREQVQHWKCGEGGLDFEADLILEESGVLEHVLVEEVAVGEGGEEEVED